MEEEYLTKCVVDTLQRKFYLYSNEGDKWRQSDIKFQNSNTLLINIKEKFIGERGRINCSLRDQSGFWRWLGVQFVVSDK